MNISNNIVIIAVVIAVLLLLLKIMWPKDDALHRNMGAGFVKFILFVLVIAIIICLLIGVKIVRNSIGDLTTDYDKQQDASITPNPKADEEIRQGELTVSVRLNKIVIGGQEYEEVSEARGVIEEAVAAGSKITVIDEYALASTYNELIDAITSMNVDRTDIEEKETGYFEQE
ncbi:MAG: hypothetical protein K5662_06095 [Lachnospiraceae bacterium]|nr:hypothetical protein [Lachnospiraceae bacterium]